MFFPPHDTITRRKTLEFVIGLNQAISRRASAFPAMSRPQAGGSGSLCTLYHFTEILQTLFIQNTPSSAFSRDLTHRLQRSRPAFQESRRRQTRIRSPSFVTAQKSRRLSGSSAETAAHDLCRSLQHSGCRPQDQRQAKQKAAHSFHEHPSFCMNSCAVQYKEPRISIFSPHPVFRHFAQFRNQCILLNIYRIFLNKDANSFLL